MLQIFNQNTLEFIKYLLCLAVSLYEKFILFPVATQGG